MLCLDMRGSWRSSASSALSQLVGQSIGGDTLGPTPGLLGLLRCDDADVSALLAELDVSPDDLRTAILRTVGRAA